ncbi:MAG TPA: hypothetical protein VG889_03145 [Rhizomicrobium sp.]|nr:hypothetical protein [Rhizomicrobium sp.]
MRNATLLSLAFAAVAPGAFAGAFAAPLGFNTQLVVAADGTPVRAGKALVTHAGSGQYEVAFSSDLKTCAYVVTPGTSDTAVPTTAVATAVRKVGDRDTVVVSTYDNRGNAIDSGFHLIVHCQDTTSDGAAVVNSDGSLARGILASSAARVGTGDYTVTFTNPNVAPFCAYTAAIGLSGTSGTEDPGLITVSQSGTAGAIEVRTYDTHAVQADRGFHVFAACPR